MATESIMRTIVLTEPEETERFINAMEKAMKVAETPLPCRVKSSDYTPEEMREALGKILGNVRNQRK